MSNTTQQHDADYSFEKVPSAARKGFFAMFFIMLGFTFFSASMWAGADLGKGLDFSNFVWAILIGGAILAAYTGILGYIGCTTGLSFDLLAQRSFGKKGSYLASLFIGFTQIGWFGVGVAMFAIPVAKEFGFNPILLVILAGICMTASAYFGIRGMEIVSYISVPLIAVLGTYSMYLAISDGGGLLSVFAKGAKDMTLFTAVGIVIGSFVSGGTATPNFTRFADSSKSAVISTIVAFFLGNTLMFAFGAVGGAYTQGSDIFDVMILQGLFWPALIVLGANIWTTNDNALYTGGLGLANITKIHKRPMVLIAGAVGTATAIWLYNNFCGWLSFLNATLPPIGAIITFDFFMNRKAYAEGSEPQEGINWGAVFGVILGALAGNFFRHGIASINAMIVGCACYYIYNKAIKK